MNYVNSTISQGVFSQKMIFKYLLSSQFMSFEKYTNPYTPYICIWKCVYILIQNYSRASEHLYMLKKKKKCEYLCFLNHQCHTLHEVQHIETGLGSSQSAIGLYHTIQPYAAPFFMQARETLMQLDSYDMQSQCL